MEQQQRPADPANVPQPQTGQPANADLSSSLLAQFQPAMVQWLELCKLQQQVSQRFLETQEAVILACLQSAGGSLPAAALSRLSAATERATAPPSATPSVPPAPVLPIPQTSAGTVTPPAAPAAVPAPPQPQPTPVQAQPPQGGAAARPAPQPAVAPVPQPAAAQAPPPQPVAPQPAAAPPAPAEAPAQPAAASEPVAAAESSAPAAAPAAPQATASSNGPPPVEVFRRDLLQAISDRTGYPEEMLEDDLALEAGLGIDSIKTVEIFGSLSQYHAYLPGASEDQEESLASFAQMTTISDIVKAYETNTDGKRQASAAGETAAGGQAQEEQAASAEQAPVERMTLQAAQAPRSADGSEKKNSLKGTSS
jgi:hypothetical protein